MCVQVTFGSQIQCLLVFVYLLETSESVTVPIINKINQVINSGDKLPLKSLDQPEPILYHREIAGSDQPASPSFEQKQYYPNSNDVADGLQIPKKYAFSYAIKDRQSGDDFSHAEAHTGKATKGEYRVKLPDGRIQVVSYTADNNGYRANIKYEKEDDRVNRPVFEGDNSNLRYSPKVAAKFEPDNSNLNGALNGIPKFLRDPALRQLKDIRVNLTSNSGTVVGKTAGSRTGLSIATPVAASSLKPVRAYKTVEDSEDNSEISFTPRLVNEVNHLLRFLKPIKEENPKFPVEPLPTARRSSLFRAATEAHSARAANNVAAPPDFDGAKYIHIHRYHPTKGETVTSNLVTSKEIFDQNYSRNLFPSVFNSSFSDPFHSTTGTGDNFKPSIGDGTSNNYFNRNQPEQSGFSSAEIVPAPPPPPPSSNVPHQTGTPHSSDFVQHQPVSLNSIESPHTDASGSFESGEHDNSLIPLSDIDARKLSGYFDFVQDDEADSAEQVAPLAPENNSLQSNSPPGSAEHDSYPANHQAYSLSPDMQYVEGERNGLPHYYYEFSTATPSYRYVDPQFNSQAPPPPSSTTPSYSTITPTMSPFNGNRPYPFLRPLTRERVYIHHNSQPAVANGNGYFPTSSSTVGPTVPAASVLKHNDGDVTIIKSISSTIPPELIDAFDQQLPSSSNLSPIITDNSLKESSSSQRTVSIPEQSVATNSSSFLQTNNRLHRRRSAAASDRSHQPTITSSLKPKIVRTERDVYLRSSDSPLKSNSSLLLLLK